MFCNKCGEILRDNALRCPVCGAFQTKRRRTQINEACDCDTNKEVTFDLSRPKTHSSSDDRWKEDTRRYYKNMADRFFSPEHQIDAASIEGIIRLLKRFFANWKNFSGRTSRSEFWWTYLFILVPTLLLYLFGGGLMVLWYLAILVPLAAMGVRRLHDVGRSGWWLLIKLIPIAGLIVLILWFCQDSAPTNQYGPRTGF